MVKLLVFAVRKAGMSFDEFDAYWRDKHGPLIRNTTDVSKRIRKYVQSHRASSDVPLAAGGRFDGVAELWFDSLEDLNATFNEQQYLDVIRPDELKFVDLDNTVSIVCEEHQVI